jgi:hypothetical protein
MADCHCAHVDDQERRIRDLEVTDRIRDAVLAGLRWGLPVLIALCAVIVAVAK